MAYRMLFCVACVTVGLGLVGCGGNTGTSAGDPTNSDSPPSSPEAPPQGADDSPPNGEEVPPGPSEDSPPGSPDAPAGGGRLRQLCESACDAFEALAECGEGDFDAMTQELCANNGCAAAVDPGVPIPCIDQIEALFRCFANLADTCMPSEAEAERCLGDVEAFSECADDVEPGPGPVPNPDPPNQGEMCTEENFCQECETVCDTCLCSNPDNEAACDVVCESDN